MTHLTTLLIVFLLFLDHNFVCKLFLSKSLPDLSKVSWVLRTEEYVLGELADEALDYLYDSEISKFYEDAKKKAIAAHSTIRLDTG